MKRTFKISLIIILLIATATATTAVFAQNVTYTAVINSGALNVRQGPGVEYAPVTVAFQGQTVILLGRNNSSTWAKIRTNSGHEGWVNASYIIPNNVAISSLPVMTSTATPLPPPPVPVAPGGIAVRSGPGFNYPAAGFVENGSYITLLGRNYNNTWVKVSANNNTLVGWMNASVIETNLPIANLPIVDGSAPTTPPPTTPNTPPPGAATATVNTGALNVRSGPGLGYNILGQVYLGQTITLIGRNYESTWVRIVTGQGNQGWVSAGLIQTNTVISSLPVVDAPTLDKVGVVNTGAANVRHGPGLEYNPITTVFFGTKVTLLGRNSAGNWLLVRLANGTQGWVHESLLDENVTVGSLPVVG